jgi:hypothetical protein
LVITWCLRASLIVTSNKPFGCWGAVFGDDSRHSCTCGGWFVPGERRSRLVGRLLGQWILPWDAVTTAMDRRAGLSESGLVPIGNRAGADAHPAVSQQSRVDASPTFRLCRRLTERRKSRWPPQARPCRAASSGAHSLNGVRVAEHTYHEATSPVYCGSSRVPGVVTTDDPVRQ